jgi:hypothetical protein
MPPVSHFRIEQYPWPDALTPKKPTTLVYLDDGGGGGDGGGNALLKAHQW